MQGRLIELQKFEKPFLACMQPVCTKDKKSRLCSSIHEEGSGPPCFQEIFVERQGNN